MIDDQLKFGTKIVTLITILYFGALGIDLVFIPFLSDHLGVAKLLDPETVPYFGIMLLSFAFFSTISLLSNSRKLLKPVMLTIFGANVGSFLANLYQYMFENLQADAVYLIVGIETFIGAVLCLLVLCLLLPTKMREPPNRNAEVDV
jgi:uncharacterized membrane protein YeaQ/YmgE (transglycosylase-associated protein family)